MNVLVTAGPTREAIDPVRYISNRSSGKMGYAVARAAREAGHAVTLVSGPVTLKPPEDVKLVPVTAAEEMFHAVHALLDSIDVLVMCAAVADYRCAEVAKNKLKKSESELVLRLVPTRDILRSLPRERKFAVIGFAAETTELRKNAARKLREKGCDVVVANDVSRMNTGFESDDNEVELFFADGSTRIIPQTTKHEIARELVKLFPKLTSIRS
jgi:phosphopantothenoylcysteine decarboxylase/phosphopantothenate--cysteine ligase